MTAEGVPWVCPGCGATLGIVRRSASGVRQLYLWRWAGDEYAGVVAVLEGTAKKVVCSACGAERRWVVGAEALARLLAHYAG